MASDARPRRHARPPLARKAEELALREHLFPAGCCALVMVSGGQDSLALLHVLATSLGRKGRPASVHALHVNHHLRGDESDDDEALVVQTCGQLGVGLTVVHRPIVKSAGDVQEAARDARREAALAVAGERSCDRIVLGHTADDQVETMLYRLGRYGGLAAFAAMKPCDPPWVRPLLDCRRDETAAFCREHGLVFANDRGNAYPGYARTAIRQVVVPAWEQALPGAVDAACRAAEVAAEMRELVQEVLADTAAMVTGRAGRLEDAEFLSAAALLALSSPVRRLVLHRWLEGRARPAASRAGVLAVESLLVVAGCAERTLAGGLSVVKEYDRLFLATRETGRRSRADGPADLALPPVVLPVPGETKWGGFTVTAEHAGGFRFPDVAREAFLDGAAIGGGLEVRGPKTGDRFRPLGAPGRRKLQDFFVDLRIPVSRRAGWPLVVSGARILWVCGLALAEEGRIGAETKSVIRLSWDGAVSGLGDERGRPE